MLAKWRWRRFSSFNRKEKWGRMRASIRYIAGDVCYTKRKNCYHWTLNEYWLWPRWWCAFQLSLGLFYFCEKSSFAHTGCLLGVDILCFGYDGFSVLFLFADNLSVCCRYIYMWIRYRIIYNFCAQSTIQSIKPTDVSTFYFSLYPVSYVVY